MSVDPLPAAGSESSNEGTADCTVTFDSRAKGWQLRCERPDCYCKSFHESDCPEPLKHFWSGHAFKRMSECYLKLTQDRDFRLR